MGKLKKFFSKLGPGLITGAADDDPSGIATYSQSGAEFGYKQLWAVFFTLPFMIVIQEMCGRIGMVTGKGLSGVMRKYYARPVLYSAVFILVTANTINISADLGAMAAGAQLVFHLPFAVWLLALTALTLILQIFIPYKTYAKYLKYLALTLLAYVITAFCVKQDWHQIGIHTFTPYLSLDKKYLMNIVGFLGTTISPYLFFWQADEEVEEEVATGKLKTLGHGIPKIFRRDVRGMRWDTILGMIFSNIMTFFIIVTTASTLGKYGITNIETADQAALALRPIAGNFAFLLFAIGIIGTGLLGVPVLAGSASYAVTEAIGWRAGLYRKLKDAHGFYGVIAIATIIGLILNFTSIQPFTLLYYAAILNGICAPPLMAIIVLISANKKIMGKYKSSPILTTLGVIGTLLMAAAASALLYNIFTS